MHFCFVKRKLPISAEYRKYDVITIGRSSTKNKGPVYKKIYWNINLLCQPYLQNLSYVKLTEISLAIM